MAELVSPKQYRDWDPAAAEELIRDFTDQPQALMEALHRIQNTFGFVGDEAIRVIASTLNVSRAETYGVASFYHDFKSHRPGRYEVKVCQAEACQAMGAEQLTEDIKQHLRVGFHETTPGGNFTLEPVYCLGNCACSPNIMIDRQVYARMDIERFKSLTESLVKEDD